MAIDVGKLRVILGLNDKEFRSGMKNANTRLQAFSKRLAIGAGALAGAAATGLAFATKASFRTIDAQAKLAQSMGTSTKSIQVLDRAANLAGVSLTGLEGYSKDLFRRLSQAANDGKSGPAKALDRLKLSAEDLLKLPLDERVGKINSAIEKFIPVAQRAAVAGQLFGEEGSVAMSRIDAATLAQATKDVKDFGVAVSDVDADKIEMANDAISRLGLIAVGTGNKLAAALAPMVTAAAEAIADLFREGGAAYVVIGALTENMGRLATYAATAAAIVGGRLAAGIALAALKTASLSGALVVLRGAIVRTGIGALIILAGEMVYRFMNLVKASGGFGNALGLLKDVAVEAFQRIGDAGTYLKETLLFSFDEIKAGWSNTVAWMQKRWADWLHNTAASLRDVPGMNWAYEAIGGAAIMAGSKMYEMNLATDAARQSALGHAQAIKRSAKSMIAPLKSMDAIRAVMAEAADETDNAGTSAEDLKTKLDELNNLDSGSGGLGKVKDAAKDAAETVKDLATDIRDTLQSSLGNAFDGLLQGTASVRQALAGIFSDLARMAANRLIQQMLGGIFGGGAGGGFLGKLIPGFATGTSYAPGGMALVGERGPELVNLPRGSQVIPNSQIGAAAAPKVSIVNVLDPSLVGDYLDTAPGEARIMNIINRNK